MFARLNDAAKVGIWAVAVAAVAGLLVLLLQSRAHAEQPTSAAELAAALSERQPWTGEERLDAAEDVLRRDQRRRVGELTRSLLRTGWDVVSGASPGGAVRGAVDVFRKAAAFAERSAAEDRALDLLEPAIATGRATPSLEQRYLELLERERSERLERQVEGAETAFAAGELRLARLRAQRWLVLEPESERAAELLELARRDAAPRAAAELEPVRDWEAGLALALLAEDYERAARFEGSTPDARLARAVAHELSGRREQSLAALDRLGEERGVVGDLARSWSDTPERRIESEFEQARRRYRTRRALGWLGGERLSEEGLELSRDGVRAWRESLSLTNVAMRAPLRLYRGWRVEDDDMIETARRYVALRPDGEHAAEATAWLERSGRTADPRHRAWDDGRFVLPRARTPYRALAPQPLLLSRAVVESEAISRGEDLQALLGDARALRLAPRPRTARHALPDTRARALLLDLAEALRTGALDPHGSSRSALLEGVRRMELALDAGLALVPEPWSPLDPALVAGLGQLLLADAGTPVSAPGATDLVDDISEDGELVVDRGFGEAQFDCPDETLCIDREGLVTGSVFGRVEVDGDLKVGAHTRIDRASFSLELGAEGPQASLVLPLGHWLRIERWVPLEARLAVGLGGVAIDPSLAR